MAKILNATGAWLSAGGTLYSLEPKIYITGVSGQDAYINYDSQGNFTIKGCFVSSGSIYQSNSINYPNWIFSQQQLYPYNEFAPIFQQSPQLIIMTDSSGNNVLSQYQLFEPNTFIEITRVDDTPIPPGTYYFTVTGQATLQTHML